MSRLVLALALVVHATAGRTAVTVPNPSFETGDAGPDGWTLESGKGRWLDGSAADGTRAAVVTGTGEDESFWKSVPVPLDPGRPYVIRFRARRLEGAGPGTAVSGASFCNRDLGALTPEWKEYRSVLTVPHALPPRDGWLRFGQWHLKGALAFDDVRLAHAEPVYVRAGDLLLGEGERVSGSRYEFTAPFGTESRNHARPLAVFTARFNTNRWVFAPGQEVAYRHRIGGRTQTGAEVAVSVGYHVAGTLYVAASRDGGTWTELGTITGVERKSFPVPPALLPAPELRIRLQVRTTSTVADGAGVLQVNGYDFRSSLTGAPMTLRGRTTFVAIVSGDPKLWVSLDDVGDMTPGGRNAVRAFVSNFGRTEMQITPRAAAERDGAGQLGLTYSVPLPPGEHLRTIPYQVGGPGEYTLAITMGPQYTYRAETWFTVPALHETAFGERLPQTTPDAALWWCGAGWKISETRPPPDGAGTAIRIRAARNEAECAQLVLRPAKSGTVFAPVADALRGPGGAVIPSANIDLLRERYVAVEHPTDALGSVGRWPDPLPAFTRPVVAAAGMNLPVWIRVRVPRDAPPGAYTGRVTLGGPGWSASATLIVEVAAFTLPDRMTLTTAFGLDHDLAFRYHRVKTDADRRAVLERYLENLAAHHISPYCPAPLDPFTTTWPGTGRWDGGIRDTVNRATGNGALFVEDALTTAQPAVKYTDRIAIPRGGVKLSFTYRTKTAGQRFIVSLSHDDAHDDWMPGRNTDLGITGNGSWQTFTTTITGFPAGAATFRLTLYGSLWDDNGATTGAVWYDDLALTDLKTGTPLVTGGEFEPLPPDAITPTIDWTAWDKEMTRTLAKFKFNSFAFPVPGMGGGTFHSRSEPTLLGYPGGSSEYTAAFAAWCGQAQHHLKAKGWLTDAFVYWFDEPDPKDYDFVMNGFGKLKKHFPGLTRMLTEQPERDLFDGPNLWCPVLESWNAGTAADRRKKGDRFWWYICTGPKEPYVGEFIDRQGPDHRIWLWQTWKEQVEGILIWTTNYWTSDWAYPLPGPGQNPYEDPMSWVSGYGTAMGTKAPWGNGDGRFIYPPESCFDPGARPILDAPVDSIRWEHLRDGIEDYEYLAMLQRLLKEKGKKLKPKERKDFESLLQVPESITKDLTTYSRDPKFIEDRRTLLADAIARLTALR